VAAATFWPGPEGGAEGVAGSFWLWEY